MAKLTYRVSGMRRGACARPVRRELEQRVGVESVEVDLGSKLVSVYGSGLADDARRAAIDEAASEAEAAKWPPRLPRASSWRSAA